MSAGDDADRSGVVEVGGEVVQSCTQSDGYKREQNVNVCMGGADKKEEERQWQDSYRNSDGPLPGRVNRFHSGSGNQAITNNQMGTILRP